MAGWLLAHRRCLHTPRQRCASTYRDSGPGAAAGSSPFIAQIILLALIVAAAGGGGLTLALPLQSLLDISADSLDNESKCQQLSLGSVKSSAASPLLGSVAALSVSAIRWPGKGWSRPLLQRSRLSARQPGHGATGGSSVEPSKFDLQTHFRRPDGGSPASNSRAWYRIKAS